MDQPGKRNYFNFAGGNSECGPKFGHSFNFKYTSNKRPYCEECMLKLSKLIHVETCSKCLNWNFINAEHSKECLAKNGGMPKRPFKLTLKMQEKMGKNIFNNIVRGSLNRQTAMKMIKPSNFNRDATKLILDSAFSERERTNEIPNFLCYEHPRFIVNYCNNFDFHTATSGPMHLLFLDVTNSAIGLALLLANVFDA